MMNHCSFCRIKALIIKEFYQIVRDPSSILISVLLPAILLFLYAYGVSLDIKHVKVGLVLEDTSPTAISFTKSLQDSEYFDVKVRRDRKKFYDQLTVGKIKGIVVVPSYFSSFIRKNSNVAPIQVIADGSEPNTANFVQNYIKGAFQNWLVQQGIDGKIPKHLGLVNIETRFWYNESLSSRNFLLPGSLAIIMTLIGTLLTSLVVSREWERGTMEALMATPVKIIELVMGKLISYFILGMVSLVVSVLITIVIFHIPFRGSWLLLGFVSAIFLCTALGTGLLISTLAKNQFVASQFAMMTAFLPGFILSGFIFEVSSMPAPIRLISYIVPAKYYVSSLQTLFLAGNIFRMIFYNVLIMALIATVLFLITAKKTVKRLD